VLPPATCSAIVFPAATGVLVAMTSGRTFLPDAGIGLSRGVPRILALVDASITGRRASIGCCGRDGMAHTALTPPLAQRHDAHTGQLTA